jgi:hypothetical protein
MFPQSALSGTPLLGDSFDISGRQESITVLLRVSRRMGRGGGDWGRSETNYYYVRTQRQRMSHVF